MPHRAAWILVCLSFALVAPLAASEYAVLHTGYRIHCDRHEIEGARVRLLSKDGETWLPAAAISHFEPAGIVPPLEEPANAGEPPAQPEPSLDETVQRLGEELRLHPALVHSVIAAESAYDPAAVSRKGAIGLMQLMPATAEELAVDPWNPRQNVQGGARYLKFLLERYEGMPDQLLRALAAYNAGPGAVDAHGGIPPYSETRAYVRRVIQQFLRLTREAP